ncbi:MAG: hypothetical protein GWP27_09060 [Bacteroidetes bacterium]|nr:hypothetical protein [Bacteroidota bacterium]
MNGQYVEAINWSQEVTVDKGEKVLDLFVVNDSNAGILVESVSGISTVVFAPEPERINLTTDACCSVYRHFVRGDVLSVFTRVNVEIGASRRFSQYVFNADSFELQSSYDFGLGHSAGSQAKPTFSYVSPNSEYAMACQQSPFKRSVKASIKLILFDDKEQIDANIPTDFSGDDFEILGASIDDNKQVYIVAKTGIKLNSPFRRKHLLLSYNHAEQKLTEFDLSSDKLFIQDLLIRTNSEGIELASLYTVEPLEETYSDGYVYIKTDPIGENLIDRRIRTFSSEMIASHRSVDDKKSGIEHVFLDGIFTVEGEPLVTFERRFQDQVCTTDPRTGIVSCTDMFYFKGVSIETPRDRMISYTIQRNQVDVDRLSAYSTHAWTSTSEGQMIFYNDHFKNQNQEGERMMNNASRSALRFVYVDHRGFSHTGVLTEEKQNDFVFVPMVGIETSGNWAFLIAKDGREHRIGKLNLNELLPRPKGN